MYKRQDHLCVDFVMMASGSVERQRRYIARIAADPQKSGISYEGSSTEKEGSYDDTK